MLAALLDVSLSDLEARLILSVPANPGLGQENRKTVWATVLAIKLFETQLAGERGVWQLVVDKARAWIAGVGVEDIAQFEKMAGEVLGGRTNPAPFECDICKATFTRSHNLRCMSRSSAIVIHI